jgi:hypothetical protein
MQTYAIARLDEIDPLPDGRFHYRPVRHHLGIQGFGVTAWVGGCGVDHAVKQRPARCSAEPRGTWARTLRRKWTRQRCQAASSITAPTAAQRSAAHCVT